MSKKFKGKQCAYCWANSATSDHVFAREFFLPTNREDLPQVPACKRCNEAKSRLEHQFTALFPFGGRHTAARETLTSMVPRRLARNQKLHRTLRAGWTKAWSKEGNAYVRTSAVPINSADLERFFEYIVKGLLVFHWNTYLGPEDSVTVLALTQAGEEYFDGLLRLGAKNRVRVNLGSRTFAYEGAQAVDLPQISVWRIEAYGGARFADPAFPGDAASRIGILTGPRSAGDDVG